jgi:hypothetical protein
LKIYISHSSDFDYQTELYNPIKEASFYPNHEFFFPHDTNNVTVKSKDYIKNCDLVIAEVSRPSTGQGIELGWADSAGTRIFCIYREDRKPSSSVKFLTGNIMPYNNDTLVKIISKFIS